MGKNIVQVTSKKKEAIRQALAINRNFLRRKIMRLAYVTPISRSYVRTLMRKGYPVPKKNYAVALKNK